VQSLGIFGGCSVACVVVFGVRRALGLQVLAPLASLAPRLTLLGLEFRIAFDSFSIQTPKGFEITGWTEFGQPVRNFGSNGLIRGSPLANLGIGRLVSSKVRTAAKTHVVQLDLLCLW
jgi:hypothetical protein